MGDDENNQAGKSADPAPTAEPAGAEPGAKSDTKEASLGDRKNAAKAFYRALYSGEDVVPDDFGIGSKSVEKQAPNGPCPNCARFEAEAKEAEKKATENENYYKRIAADFENYRKRNDRERDEAVGLGIQKAIEAILPALDDLDRAKMSLAAVTDTKSIVDSLNLVFARFTKCLDPLGVKTMEVLGEHFDPKFHEPVQEVKTPYFADGAVAQELRRGYMMRDKVIRPALVNVASNESGVITPMPSANEAAPEPAPEPAAAAPAVSPSEPEPAAAEDSGAAAAVGTVEPTTEEAKSGKSDSKADSNGEHADEDLGGEVDKSAADQAANKQRAANALERLRKPNPKATAELPAFNPDESERVTEHPASEDSNSESKSEMEKSSEEDEATKDASNNSD